MGLLLHFIFFFKVCLKGFLSTLFKKKKCTSSKVKILHLAQCEENNMKTSFTFSLQKYLSCSYTLIKGCNPNIEDTFCLFIYLFVVPFPLYLHHRLNSEWETTLSLLEYHCYDISTAVRIPLTVWLMVWNVLKWWRQFAFLCESVTVGMRFC